MKAQILFLALVLFVGLNGFKNGKKAPVNTVFNTSITGVVIDTKTKESLVGVEVKIEGTEYATYTDFDGKFSFDHVAPGDYTIQTSYISYSGLKSKPIQLNNNEMHNLNLELSQKDK